MIDKRRYSDRREYLIAAVRKRRKKIREMAIEYKGGKCEICGYNKCLEAMEFHHFRGNSKDFGISQKGYTRGWNKVKVELDKCIMLCANCHREVHSGMLQLSRVIGIEKLGEFRETLISPMARYGNPEPSSVNGIEVTEKVQRLWDEEPTNKPYSTRVPLLSNGI